MLTPNEVLFRARKGRKNMAKAYLNVRKKHGWQAAGKLWREVGDLRRKAYAPGGDAYKARKVRPVGLQALLSDGTGIDVH